MKRVIFKWVQQINRNRSDYLTTYCFFLTKQIIKRRKFYFSALLLLICKHLLYQRNISFCYYPFRIMQINTLSFCCCFCSPNRQRNTILKICTLVPYTCRICSAISLAKFVLRSTFVNKIPIIESWGFNFLCTLPIVLINC